MAARRSCLLNMAWADRAREINRRAAALARQAADEAATPAQPRFVAGSMGPTTKAISVTGGITFDQLRANFLEQARGLIEGGADLLLARNLPGHAQHQGRRACDRRAEP